MRFQRTICATLVAAALSGCAAVNTKPMPYPENAVVTERSAMETMGEAWNNAAVQREGKAMLVLVTPFSVPAEVRAKQIRLELESGATVKDLVAVMGNLGYSIILADKDAGEKQFFMPRFSGAVGSLLSTVSKATDVWFTWNNGTIVVSSSEKISVTLPQEEALAIKVAEGLKALGVESAASSWEAGMVTLSVTPTQFARVRAYLKRMTSNAALVSLQVAILNVQLAQESKQGIDWTKLQLAVGRNYAASGIQTMDGLKPVSGNSSFTSANSTGTTGNTGTTGTPGTTGTTGTTGTAAETTAAVADVALTAFGMASGGFKGLLTNHLFSFTGLYDFLQTYGSTETKQNVVLKTIAGTSVELKSLTQTPYVESIAVTSTGTTNGTAGGGTMGSAKTAKADDGLTLKMTPMFDAAANTVTVKMELSLKAVLGFNSLSAGTQIGTLSQPTTAERSFNDVLRVRPGQTVVVGGITYDSVGDTGNGPNVIQPGSRWDYKALKVSRNSLFIVVRPTVVSLGQVTEEENLDLFAEGKAEPEAAKAPARQTKKVTKTADVVAKPAEVVSKEVVAPPVSAPKAAYDADGYASVPLRIKE